MNISFWAWALESSRMVLWAGIEPKYMPIQKSHTHKGQSKENIDPSLFKCSVIVSGLPWEEWIWYPAPELVRDAQLICYTPKAASGTVTVVSSGPNDSCFLILVSISPQHSNPSNFRLRVASILRQYNACYVRQSLYIPAFWFTVLGRLWTSSTYFSRSLRYNVLQQILLDLNPLILHRSWIVPYSVASSLFSTDIWTFSSILDKVLSWVHPHWIQTVTALLVLCLHESAEEIWQNNYFSHYTHFCCCFIW